MLLLFTEEHTSYQKISRHYVRMSLCQLRKKKIIEQYYAQIYPNPKSLKTDWSVKTLLTLLK